MAPSAPAPAKGGPQKGTQTVRPRSFLVGTQSVIEGGDYDQTVSTYGTTFPNWSLTATGWLRELVLDLTYTVSSNAVVTVTTAENFPFNLLGNLQLNDINNEPIYGPFDSYTAMLTNKYGGYGNYEDPATAATTYTVAGTGTNAAASSSHFVLRVPLEIVQRDPLGPIASVNNTAALTLLMTFNTSANLYSAAPTNAGSLRVRGTQVFYWEPRKADKSGRPIAQTPPSAGTTQYWTQTSTNIASGTNNLPINAVLGYPWRSYLFMEVRSSSTRANGDADWPDPLASLKFEANLLVTNYQKSVWKTDMARNYGYPNPQAYTATASTGGVDTRLAVVSAIGTAPTAVIPGLENGVYVLNWNREFAFGKPGSETRRNYLVTSIGSNWILNGSFGNAGTLYSIINYIAPAGGNKADTSSLTGGQ